MANQMGTGAVHCFVQASYMVTPQYLGTCEQMPNDTRNPEYELLMNDFSGSKKPLDLAFEGEDATVNLVLTRFNQPTVHALQTKPTVARPNGTWNAIDVGRLMGFEGLFWRLWLVYTFGAAIANVAAYTASGLRRGRFYPQCVVWAPTTEEVGTRPTKQHVMFYAWPQLRQLGNSKIFTLYSMEDSDIPASLGTLIT